MPQWNSAQGRRRFSKLGAPEAKEVSGERRQSLPRGEALCG
jgi:hypothetical protein